ncbi:low molecular weight phosphotyrosine protein phosphatase [Phycisphaerales bacterium]|nr:low molecular weight phosphotyrosine protein phosphatase [Phycisphaerales bacterium]
MTGQTGVLFICLGNICRSPMARMVFADLTTRRGLANRFLIDSCGTGDWHAGEGADPRTVAVARARGLDASHIARALRPGTDFVTFEYLIAMDLENRSRLLHLGAPRERVHLLRAFDPALSGRPESELVVPDPYYGGDNGFEAMYEMVNSACEGLLARVSGESGQ